MGRGDKRTRKGKIFAGSYGKTRPQGKKKNTTATTESKGDKAEQLFRDDMEISDVIKELRELNELETKHFRLPKKNEVAEAETRLGVKFSEDYKQYLLEASDVVYGAIEPAVVVPNSGYLNLVEVADSAWNEMEIPRDLLPICEDNGDYYCLNEKGEVVFWSHNGAADEKWDSLADWIKEVWIEGN